MRVKIIDNYCKYLNTKFDKFSWETNSGLFLFFLFVFASLLLTIIPAVVMGESFGSIYAFLIFVVWGIVEFLLFSCCVVSANVVYKKLSEVIEERKKEK